MKKPGFLEGMGEARTSKRVVTAAAAGGMAVGLVVGVGIAKGFDFVMRGFMGLPKGQHVHNGADGWIPPHQQQTPPRVDVQSRLADEAAPHTEWPATGTVPSPGAVESTSLLHNPEDRQ